MPHNDINKKRNKMETRMREILKDVKSERLTENEAVMELCILFTVSNNEVAVCSQCGKDKKPKEKKTVLSKI